MSISRSGVPGLLPAGQVEHAVQQVRGQPPDQMIIDARTPGRCSRTGGRPGPDWPGVDQHRHRNHRHRGRLARIDRAHRLRRKPPADHRGHVEAADVDVGRRQRPEHLDAGPVDPGLLRGLPQRGVGQVDVARVGRPAGEGDLPGVGPHGRRRAPRTRSPGPRATPRRSRSTPRPARAPTPGRIATTWLNRAGSRERRGQRRQPVRSRRPVELTGRLPGTAGPGCGSARPR